MPPAKPTRPDATLTSLYKAVLAAPDDDLPRLVYADRLDELGNHPRAEFIRLQIHVANTKPWEEGHADALVKSEAIYERYKDAWGIEDLTRDLMRSKGVTPGVFNPFVRGFPEVTWAAIETFSAAHRKALKKYPVRELVLVGGHTEAVNRVGEFITEVGASAVDLSHAWSGVFATLVSGRPLPGVKKLVLNCDVYWPSAEMVQALAASGHFPNVEAVQLTESVVEARMRAFVGHLRWPKVTDVTLLGVFDRTVVQAIAGAKWLANARRLSVENTVFDDGAADITPLFRSPHLRNLRELDLEGVRFDAAAARAFAASTLGPLDRFRLSADNAVPFDAFATLLSAPALAAVKSLDLPTLDDRAAEAAAIIGRNGDLRQLTWGGRGFPPEALEALANSAAAAQSLRRLSLEWASLSAAGVKALLAVPWPNLAELTLEFGRHDGREVARLIDHPHFARLTHLDVVGLLRKNDLWKALAKSETVGRFHKLRLGFPIDDTQLNALLDNPEACKVGHLALPNRVKVGRTTQRRYEKVFGVRITRDW